MTKTAFESKALVETKNMSWLDAAKKYHVQIFLNEKWNFEGDFTISVLVSASPATLPTWPIVLFASNVTTGAKIQMHATNYTNDGRLQGVSLELVTNSGATSLHIQNTKGAPGTELTRYTFTRIGSTIKFYFNARLIQTGSLTGTISLYANPGDVMYIGALAAGTTPFTGKISNLIVLNGKGMSDKEIDELHISNVPPKTTHFHVVAHYPMNEDVDSVVHDVSDRYNYSKQLKEADIALNGDMSVPQTQNQGTGWFAQTAWNITGGVAVCTNGNGNPTGYLYQTGGTKVIIGGRYRVTYTVVSITSGMIRVFAGNGDIMSDPRTIAGTYTDIVVSNQGGPVVIAGYGPCNATVDNVIIEPLTIVQEPNHADLINFSNDGVGIPNELLQSAWYNLYDSAKRGISFLKLNAGLSRAQLAGYTEVGLTGWFLFLDVYTTDVESGGNKLLFSNLDAASEVSVFLSITGAIDIYLNRSAGTVASQIFGIRVGKRTKILLTCNGTNTQVWFQGEGYAIPTLQATMTKAPNDFTNFAWLGTSSALQCRNSGVTRCIFGTKFLSDYERQSIFNYEKGFAYRSIPLLKFDIDFGDIYFSTGNYFAKDKSVNNRNPQLYSFTPSTDQPITVINSPTGVPDRKALKFNPVSSQSIIINGFAPSKTAGYSIVFIFSRQGYGEIFRPTPTICTFYGKRSQAGTYAEEMHGLNNTTAVIGYFSGVYPQVDYKKIGGLRALALTLTTGGILRFYTDGILNVTVSTALLGMDTELSNTGEKFYIGYENGHYMEGYLSHFSFYRGILTPKEINDIIFLNQPPHRLWSECQLWLNFEEIKFLPTKQEVTTPTGFVAYQPCNIAYGSDSDGSYVEVTGIGDPNGIASYNVAGTNGYMGGVNYAVTVKFKFMDAASVSSFSLYYFGVTSVSTTTYPPGTAQTVTFIMTPPGSGVSNFCLFTIGANGTPMNGKRIRVYYWKVVRKDGYIKDHSPQNRSFTPFNDQANDCNIVLKNYSDNEVNPAHADYRLIDPEILVDPSKKPYSLPSSIVAKAWAWYDVVRSDLAIATFNQATKWINKLLDSSRDLISGNGLTYERYQNTTNYILNAPLIAGSRSTQLLAQSKNLDFMHNGGSWFLSFLYYAPGGTWTSNLPGVLDSRGGGRGVRVVFSPYDNLLQILIVGDSGNVVTFNNTNIAHNQGQLNLYVISFDAAAGSNHMSVYMNGVLIQQGTSSGAYAAGASGGVPIFFGYQPNSDPKAQKYGEMVIGNQALTVLEADELYEYYFKKYPVIPVKTYSFIEQLAKEGVTLNGTQTSAINTLISDLQAAGIWNKAKAIYPFIGGTANTHRYNLKDPRNLDASFRLSFVGGWTHDVNGITADGTTAYARTFFIEQDVNPMNDFSTGIYIRNNTALVDGTDIGFFTTIGQVASYIKVRNTIDKLSEANGGTGNTVLIDGVTDSRGLSLITRTGLSCRTTKNGSDIGTRTIATSYPGYIELFIGALNIAGSPGQFSNRNYAFAFIGRNLTTTEVTALYTAVQAYQTTLGRQV